MPYTDSPDSSQAKITDIGRSYFARSILGDVSFKAIGFTIGKSGYIDSNPVKILPINTADTDLIAPFYPLIGVNSFETIEIPEPKTVVLNCRLGHSNLDNIGAIGELGIWGEVLYSTVPAEIGTTFLFAIAHNPILVKNLQNVFVYRILTQF
jgi:hypothetical protein